MPPVFQATEELLHMLVGKSTKHLGVDTKIWFERRRPQGQRLIEGKLKYSVKIGKQNCHQPNKMTPSFQGNGPHPQGRQDMEQEEASNFIEGKD
jgi:hypothetical protein